LQGAKEFNIAGSAAAERAPKGDPTVLVRKLGGGAVPTYLERTLSQEGEDRFVIVERVPRDGMTDDDVRESLREARLAASVEHPNVVPVRDIAVGRGEISVMSDYAAGERLSDLWPVASTAAPAIPLEIALRILVDVATGLGALHKLRGEEGHDRIKFVHAEVTASNVIVGLDGVSLLLRAARVRRGKDLPDGGLGYLAPEVLSHSPADQRADVYSLGALLWQALSGRPLYPEGDAGAIVASIERGAAEKAVVASSAPWALPLADVAARALASAPEKRFPTTASMVTELRRIAGPKLASAVDVAQFVESRAGEKIAARLSDVQASAVIRKATSIPAPSSSSPDSAAAVTVSRAHRESKKPPLAPAVAPAREVAPSVSLDEVEDQPKTLANPPVGEIDDQALTLANPPIGFAAPRVLAALPPVAPPPRVLAAPPPVAAAAVSPVVAEAPAVAPSSPVVVAAPPVVAPAAGAVHAKSASPARPEPARPAPSPAPQKAAPKRAVVTAPARASAARSRAVPASKPAESSSTLRNVGLTAVAILAVALVTGWLGFRAVRNRQEIATPATMPTGALPEPAPQPTVSPEPPKEHAVVRSAPRPSSGSPPPAASPAASAYAPKPVAAPKPPPPKVQRK
jgi:serine/threonine-protein kinase